MKKPLLTIKELASKLPVGPTGRPRSRGYVHAMIRAGFPVTRRQATLASALLWLSQHPLFTWTSVYNAPKHFIPLRLRGAKAPKRIRRCLAASPRVLSQ